LLRKIAFFKNDFGGQIRSIRMTPMEQTKDDDLLSFSTSLNIKTLLKLWFWLAQLPFLFIVCFWVVIILMCFHTTRWHFFRTCGC